MSGRRLRQLNTNGALNKGRKGKKGTEESFQREPMEYNQNGMLWQVGCERKEPNGWAAIEQRHVTS